MSSIPYSITNLSVTAKSENTLESNERASSANSVVEVTDISCSKDINATSSNTLLLKLCDRLLT
jgi:hypothetical protein